MDKGNQAEGDKDSNNTGSVPKGKKGKSTRQRARKHAVQGDEAGRGPEPEAQGPNADSTDPKNKRRRTGKWVLDTSPSSRAIKAVVNRML